MSHYYTSIFHRYLQIPVSLIFSTYGYTVASEIDYNRDIRPVLSDKCFHCHGPDEEGRKADLRLDQREDAMKDLGGYAAIVPGNPEGSELVNRITLSNEHEDIMPPTKSNLRLTDEEKKLLQEWIAQGAEYAEHWSFVKPKHSGIPAVGGKDWGRNEIDRFILSRLEEEGIAPMEEANRETLIRRLSLDLTGLPPSLDEIDAFLADENPDAYEKLVDRLLASPRCAERLTVDWLDVARYGDTNGYSIDDHREMWIWRDWVLKSFNENKPYDTFTIEQIAGDLIPNATDEQRIASGFNRNNITTHEGGILEEEYLVTYVSDKVNATSSAWLGLTMGCAMCHDHKYDPIKQKDYYRFFAFFNTSDEPGIGGKNGNIEPMIRVSSPLVRGEEFRKQHLSRIETLKERLLYPAEHLSAERMIWQERMQAEIDEAVKKGALGYDELEFVSLESEGKRGFEKMPDGSFVVQGKANAKDTYSLRVEANTEVIDGFTLDVYSGGEERSDYEIGNLERKDFVLSRFKVIAESGNELAFDRAVASHSKYKYSVSKCISDKPNYVKVRGKKKKKPTGWSVQASLGKKHSAFFMFKKPVVRAKGKEFTIKLEQTYGGGALIDRFRLRAIAGTTDKPTDASLAVIDAFVTKPEERSYDQRLAIANAYRKICPDTAKYMNNLEEEINTLQAAIREGKSTVMVMNRSEKPRTTHILMRGQYDAPGEVVTPAIPEALGKIVSDGEADRLDLARWLVGPENPLTSRVTVNRYWQLIFGTGIVKTSENFGMQGEPPSHPELLDWLATEFVDNGWNVKHLLKKMVMSATYRQESRVLPEALEKDPFNRLLGRGVRKRLDAEFLRDSALFTCGVLKNKLGGPSVYPYQPRDLWKEVSHFGHPTLYTAQAFYQDRGSDLYRRSIYTFWKRTLPPPGMTVFDAPSRENCTVRRETTNTPLQALALLNAPEYVEAARILALRMIVEGGDSTEEQLGYGFRLATGRNCLAEESGILVQAYEKQWAHFSKSRDEAKKLLEVGDYPFTGEISLAKHAAMTVVANILLNMDETITKH